MTTLTPTLVNTNSAFSMRQNIEQYKHILATVSSSEDAVQSIRFIDHIISNDLPRVVSRQLRKSFSQELGKLEQELQNEIVDYSPNQIQPEMVSFEDVLITGEMLAGLLESEDKLSKAAQMLSGLDFDSGIRVIDHTFMLSKCVQIACLHEEDGAVNAKAPSNFVSNSQHAELNLQYKVCYARVLDLKMKFLEAALRYYDMYQIEKQQTGDKEIDEEALEQVLVAAVTCTILAASGSRLSRLLATLYKCLGLESLSNINDWMAIYEESGFHGTTNIWVKLSEQELFVGVDSRTSQVFTAIKPESTPRKEFVVLHKDDSTKFWELGYGIIVTVSGNGRTTNSILSHIYDTPRTKRQTLPDVANLALSFIRTDKRLNSRPDKERDAKLHFGGWNSIQQRYNFCVVKESSKRVKLINYKKEFGAGSGYKRACNYFKRRDSPRNEEMVIKQMLLAASSDPYTGGNIRVYHLRMGVCRVVHDLSLVDGVFGPDSNFYERILFPHSSIMMFMIPAAFKFDFATTDLLVHLRKSFPLIKNSDVDWLDESKVMLLYSVKFSSENECNKWFSDCLSLKGPPVGYSVYENAANKPCKYIITKANKENLRKAKLMGSLEDWLDQ